MYVLRPGKAATSKCLENRPSNKYVALELKLQTLQGNNTQ